MKPKRRRTGSFVATLIVTAGTLSVAVAGYNSGQVAPPAGPSPSVPRQLSLEQRADIFMARKNYVSAADYYYRALQQSNFKDPMLWNKLGIAYQQEDGFRSAHAAFAKAIHVNKNFAEAWNNLGTLSYMGKKYGRSVKYYQRALALRNDVAAFHLNLGTSLYHLKKYDQAVAEYRTALNLDPKVISQQSAVGTVIHAGAADANFYFYMAKAYASIGDADQSVRYLRRAIEDGFSGRDRIEKDPDLQKISQHPAYIELMKNPPVAIKN